MGFLRCKPMKIWYKPMANKEYASGISTDGGGQDT